MAKQEFSQDFEKLPSVSDLVKIMAEDPTTAGKYYATLRELMDAYEGTVLAKRSELVTISKILPTDTAPTVPGLYEFSAAGTCTWITAGAVDVNKDDNALIYKNGAEIVREYRPYVKLAQELGDSESVGVSQKVVSEGIEGLINWNIISNSLHFEFEKHVLKNDGSIYYNAGFDKELVVSGFIKVQDLHGCTIGLLEAWKAAQANPIAFYNINKEVIGTAYNPATVNSETSVTIEIDDILLAQYPDAVYARLGGNTALNLTIKTPNQKQILINQKSEISAEMAGKYEEKALLSSVMLNVNGVEFLSSANWDNQKSVFLAQNTGEFVSGEGTEGYFYITPFIPVKDISKVHFSGKTFNNISICVFYDKNKNITSQINGNNETELDVVIPSAVYFVRFCGDVRHNCKVTVVDSTYIAATNKSLNYLFDKAENIYPSFRYTLFTNVVFGGDSVTKGFVVEGTETTQYIYEELHEYSYPIQFGKIHPNLNITVKAQSGITPSGWLSTFYPTVNFAEIDLFVLELGLNGGLDVNDINTAGTNTYAYKQIVAGARGQNLNLTIVLVRSQHYYNGVEEVINSLKGEYNCVYIDLHDAKYINLDDAKLHGYNSGVLDYAHFTRKGYAAKAYAVSRLIADNITDETIY